MASVAELKKSFFAEIDKVENREDLEKLREIFGPREGDSHGSFAFAWRYAVGCLFQRAHRSIVRWSAMGEMTSVPLDDASDLSA
jgi:hypothetical protein